MKLKPLKGITIMDEMFELLDVLVVVFIIATSNYSTFKTRVLLMKL